MQRASVFVGVNPRPSPREAVEEVLSYDQFHAHLAIETLLAEGFLREDDHGRLRSVKPFRSAGDSPAAPAHERPDEQRNEPTAAR